MGVSPLRSRARPKSAAVSPRPRDRAPSARRGAVAVGREPTPQGAGGFAP